MTVLQILRSLACQFKLLVSYAREGVLAVKTQRGMLISCILACGANCSNSYSNPCSVISVQCLKLLFISLDSSLVALEKDIFNLTKGYLNE